MECQRSPNTGTMRGSRPSQDLSFRDPPKLAAWRGSDRRVRFSGTFSNVALACVDTYGKSSAAASDCAVGSHPLLAGLSLCGPSNRLGLQTLPCRWHPYGRRFYVQEAAIGGVQFSACADSGDARSLSKGLRGALADGAPGVTEGVAQRILELAKAGETSPDRLCSGALRKLSH
jgi:hypothetical protein